MLVALEGIDGAGKGTQARRLHDRLTAAGVRAALMGFPRYDATLFGRAVGDFLNGRFGRLDQVSPFLAALLYAGDRFESRALLCETLANHEVVVLDRYVASNVAHQGAKLTGAQRQELIGWIEQVEYGVYELPRPDLVLLFDLPVRDAQALIARKERRTYTDRRADLQEADGEYLERVREVYLRLADGDPAWGRIDCLRAGSLRTVEEISREVEQAVLARLGSGA